MKRVLYFVSLVTLTTMFSCNKAENSSLVQADVVSAPLSLVTKAYGDKTPKLVVYVETNDVNFLTYQ